MIERIPLAAIHPNPWQTRADPDGENLAALAEDIREHGLFQPPTGRRTDDGTVQLAFGHRRLAAFALLNQDLPERGGIWDHMPIDLQDLTDRQMAEIAAVENSQRDDISAIDKAKAMQRLISDFGMTQAEAGKLFRLTQSAVSNLLRLLKLPEPIQDLIQHDILPERLARMLLSLAEVDAKACQKIANAIADAEPDTRDGVLYEELESYVHRNGHNLNRYGMPWPLEWPPSPVPSGNTHITEIPSCEGCRFNVRIDASGNERGCVRKQCYLLKEHAWAQAEAERIGQKLGIAVVGKNEKPTIIFDGRYDQQEIAQKAIASKHESLRLMPQVRERQGGYLLKSVLGAEHVHLGSLDVRALKKAIASAPKPKAPKRALSSFEKKLQQDRAERSAHKKHVRQMLTVVSPVFAPLLPDPVLDLVVEPLRWKLFDRPAKREVWNNADVNARKQIVIETLLSDYVGASSMDTPKPEAATKKLAELARAAHIKLPPGWDAAPPPAITKKPAPKPAKKARKK